MAMKEEEKKDIGIQLMIGIIIKFNSYKSNLLGNLDWPMQPEKHP